MTAEGRQLANQAQTANETFKEMTLTYKDGAQKHKWHLHFIEFPV